MQPNQIAVGNSYHTGLGWSGNSIVPVAFRSQFPVIVPELRVSDPP